MSTFLKEDEPSDVIFVLPASDNADIMLDLPDIKKFTKKVNLNTSYNYKLLTSICIQFEIYIP